MGCSNQKIGIQANQNMFPFTWILRTADSFVFCFSFQWILTFWLYRPYLKRSYPSLVFSALHSSSPFVWQAEEANISHLMGGMHFWFNSISVVGEENQFFKDVWLSNSLVGDRMVTKIPKGVINLRQFGNSDGIHIMTFYKCNVKWFRIVQGTCWMQSRMDQIKLGGIHKWRRLFFTIFWAPSPLNQLIYN